MSDGFLSRIIGLILLFLMLVVAPLINAYGVQEMENRMEILNDVSEFLDKSTDKGSITPQDLDEFYLQVESHGMSLDVEVSRLVKTATLTPGNTGEINTTYVAADDISKLNARDIVKVKIREISVTPYRKLLNIFLKLDNKTYKLDMAKMVK